ncbi:hypothetical protein TSUD_171970 [Trifolium subterraneum]|uniref:Reverse transcriptase domain-containing protein n=1 Tax=Trifolium subterraneum TaxID=3900 RepID=A0A2Z6MI35_TRISU|nr:hypothetical protein TSUD_171970 [Trifolium subterraneum]
MGESIGALMGKVEASEFYEYPGKNVIIKIKVAININNPITSGIHVGNPIDGTSWIDYRYEKLPQACFKCGLIRHSESLCRNQALDLDTLAPLGPWIRSNQYGRRKMEDKDKKFYSNPSHSKNFGHYSPPVPTELLEKLATMKASDRSKKAHRLTYNNAALSTEMTQELTPQNPSFQTKRQKMEEISRFLNRYRDSYTPHIINCSVTGGGRAGGLTLLWNHCTANMEIKNFDFNYIDMLLHSTLNNHSWRATGIYGYPQALNKYLSCRLINDLSCINVQSNWLVFGDFNLVLTSEEKSGGNPIEPNITTSFRNTLAHCDLQDLGFKGNTYTWTNKHQGDHLIQSRLDRFLATSNWISTFPKFTNNHLVTRKFEQIWTTDENHINIVRDAWQHKGSLDRKLHHTLTTLHNWGRKTFGIIPKRIKETQLELYNLQQSQNTQDLPQKLQQKERELDDLLEKEEMWWSQRLDQEMHDYLQKEFTAEEMFIAIKDMKSLAAPGPDGLLGRFYHTYWDIVGRDITKEVLWVLNQGGSPQPYNDTHICLIPKINKPSYPSEFRPISLCNVTLKIITKAIANRLKTILPTIISPNQSAFVLGRLISDNTIIANEIFHYLNQTTSKTGFMGIKTDMAKAYDRIEWDFLKSTFESMNFPQNIITTIMKCVSTVSFSILVNEKRTKSFLPKRGLRQGYPFSPYLFIICADVLSALINKAQATKLIHGVKISPGAPEITHLFFADDNLMFCRANAEETNQIQTIITQYQQASGQLVNYQKSEIIFSEKVSTTMRQAIHQILPMAIVDNYSKYLGQPTVIGKSKTQVFNFIQDKIWKKLKGWKEKQLSFAGRGTLIKVVAQAISTYLMSNFLIPKGLCNQMEIMICRFWWGSNVDKRKIHWVSWKKTCKQKKGGGMGFRDLKAFNEALLAKQGWRILTKPNSLMSRTLKAKYFPHHSFFQAKKWTRPSYSWKSIHQARWILKKGCFWIVGNGQHINIWEDRWINPQVGNTIWTTKPTNTPLQYVRDLIDPSSHNWNPQIIKQNFIPIEANQILQIPLSYNLEEDVVCWQGTTDGSYTVKSGYNAQIEWESNNSAQAHTSNQLEDSPNWNNLRNIEAPPKQLHLLWRILHNVVPVKSNLIKKGIVCDLIFPDAIRALKLLTTPSYVVIGLEWFECMQIIATITYSIWLGRNNKVFHNKDTPASEVVERAMKTLSEYHHHLVVDRISSSIPPNSIVRNNISWSPPPSNFLKLNVDAHLTSDGRWGFGMLVRSDDGRCIGAATRVCNGDHDADMAEATGLFEALKLVEKNRYSNTIIELDAEKIVLAVNKHQFPRSNWGQVVRMCDRVRVSLNHISVSWINMKGNQATHDLARWAIQEPNKDWSTNFPTCITPHIHKDMRIVNPLFSG